ncbi:hypothetical protein DXG01_014169 [Tephrocybe rancida]|nr:hypothetical protein DXG01_014169 [Tephrocybe rancida]
MHLSSLVLTALAFSPIPATLADATTAGAVVATTLSKSTNLTVTITQFSNLPTANNARAIHDALGDLKGSVGATTSDTKSPDPFSELEGSTILEEIQALNPSSLGPSKTSSPSTIALFLLGKAFSLSPKMIFSP